MHIADDAPLGMTPQLNGTLLQRELEKALKAEGTRSEFSKVKNMWLGAPNQKMPNTENTPISN